MFRLFPMCSNKDKNNCPGVLVPTKVGADSYGNGWKITWQCTYCGYQVKHNGY